MKFSSRRNKKSRRSKKLSSSISGLTLLAIGVFVLLFTITCAVPLLFVGDGRLGFMLTVLSCWGGSVLVFRGFTKTRKERATAVLGDVSLKLSSSTFLPGDSFTCSVCFTPFRQIKLNGLSYVLEGKREITQSVYNHSGSRRSSKQIDVLHDHTYQVEDLPDTYEANAEAEIVLKGKIPEDAPRSGHHKKTELGSPKVIWKLKVHLDIAKCPDWLENRTIKVVSASV